MRFYKQNSGCIYINGVSYDNLSMKEIKNKIGYMYQNPYLFNRSILENILYGTQNVSKQDVQRFMKQIGVDKEFDNLEDGIDTKAGKNGSRLSGGQKQVVLALRIYFQNPEIIILDEPTASLDKKTKVILKNLFNVLLKDRTTLIVTHDKELLELANRKLIVKDGYILDSNIKDEQNTNHKETFIMKNGLI
jgi:ABC-type bacteriocin/lantibiotic exporter with double-glycine peptidase domain